MMSLLDVHNRTMVSIGIPPVNWIGYCCQLLFTIGVVAFIWQYGFWTLVGILVLFGVVKTIWEFIQL